MNLLSPQEIYFRIEGFLVESVCISRKMFDIQGSLRKSSLEIIVPSQEIVAPLERFLTDILEAPVDCFDVIVFQDWSTPGSPSWETPGSRRRLSSVTTTLSEGSIPLRIRRHL